MERKKYDVVVIGAGSSGLTVAIGGAQIGAKVLLIEKDKIGGDCTHYGCVPSKALIHVSRNLKLVREFDSNYKVDLDFVLKEVQEIVSKIYSHETPEKVEKYGIDVKIGEVEFLNKHEVKVGNKIYYGKKIVIATGSRARIPKIEGIDSIKYMTNKEIFDPRNYKSLTIIGGGPIGCEIAQAMNNLGIYVNLIHSGSHILDREDREASKLVEEDFKNQGINVLTSKVTYMVKEIEGQKVVYFKDKSGDHNHSLVRSDEILIATGRVPNIEGLNLDKVGINYDNRGIFVNSRTRTNKSSIYAVGDVARGYQFTHFANHQGKVALTNLIFKVPFRYERVVVPRVTYVDPEIASVGKSEKDLLEDSMKKGKDFFILKKDFSEIDRAITDQNERGFFKIFVNKKGYILGACLVGKSSGELIGEISLAMKNNIRINSFADTIHPYPTYGYGLRNCADQFRSLGFTNFKKKLIKFIFGLNGK